MTSTISYRSTILACYVANFVGAIVINLTPILFIPLKLLYNLSYTQCLASFWQRITLPNLRQIFSSAGRLINMDIGHLQYWRQF